MSISNYWVTALLVLPLFTGQEISPHIPREIPCPVETVIAPCICSTLSDFEMDMDCSGVTDSDELKNIFSQGFPFNDFVHLYIKNNRGIRVLRAGDLGSATFQEIHITNGVLENIEDGALSSSYATLKLLNITTNVMSTISASEISSMQKLVILDASHNNFNSFPDLTSICLEILNFGNNPLGGISRDALQNVKNVTDVQLPSCQIATLLEGTFTELDQLHNINLDSNHLTTINTGVIDIVVASGSVSLNYNKIASIAPGALKGVRDEVWLKNNQLIVLDEQLWRPLFQNGTTLYAEGNPLSCNCSIAWVVLQETFIHRLGDDVACADGRLIRDLDRDTYVELCI
ncbi:hypothetical protein OTU49_011188 [Cherax quadricarinatus]|uniref:Oplophorus-luciferin 2-monooxygenase non-catalytic subunit n=1 Tax=Cherax quadricarinatus TaxID=27406 RepID=A0AAW0W5U1_CHEQU